SKTEGGRERVIVHLTDDSPARAAGMLDGDELVAISGEKIASAEEAVAAAARRAPGEKVAVTVLRDGQEKVMEIVVGRPPAALDSAENAGGRIRSRTAGGGLGTANVVHQDRLYILSEDGKQVVAAAGAEHVDALRNYARAMRMTATAANPANAYVAEPANRTIRVERSDLDKKLEEVGRSVESLQEQVKKLTEEIQALRSKLAEAK
ncbi:MAG TPA: PDZ domain-containing protein, partial [Pirellulales bacterium]|nr:PDZ domain-containing protein [Pirellulales bacterium]